MIRPVALVTGALTGVGRAAAFAFAQEGYRIVIGGRREAAGTALLNELHALGTETMFVRVDVRLEKEVSNLVDRTVECFGRIDAAVNNAGTDGDLSPIVDESVANYEKTFAVNVLGTLLSIKHEMRVMSTLGSGSIVNISSIGGRIGFAGASVYVASKHAVDGLTKSAALEGAPVGVRVNAVSPGPVATDMLDRFMGRNDEAKAAFVSGVPLRRAASPEEIANMIVFLSGNKASYLTGQCIAVDGGYTA